MGFPLFKFEAPGFIFAFKQLNVRQQYSSRSTTEFKDEKCELQLFFLSLEKTFNSMSNQKPFSFSSSSSF